MVVGAGLLARFATESGRITDAVVKPKLFEPTKALRLSVFRVGGLETSGIREIGIRVVEEHPVAQRLYGWGEVAASEVYDAGLQLENDDIPPLHSNIIGWPEEVSKRKRLQLQLASRARAVKLDAAVEVK